MISAAVIFVELLCSGRYDLSCYSNDHSSLSCEVAMTTRSVTSLSESPSVGCKKTKRLFL
ncbi:hypothetical protein PMAC_001102 [Pneumocystis sp. 'macacae']|nr:hypothetical protein PMAC_001102 [Pneumocystis sp. 'macacae']